MIDENQQEQQPEPQPATDPEPRVVVGYVWCPKCLMDDAEEVAQVRKNIKGKLYYVCPTHSIDLCTSKQGQDWLLRHTRATPDQLKKKAVPQPPAPPEQPKKDAPKKKAGGFLNHIKDW